MGSRLSDSAVAVLLARQKAKGGGGRDQEEAREAAEQMAERAEAKAAAAAAFKQSVQAKSAQNQVRDNVYTKYIVYMYPPSI
jgi:hypothetical protein